MACQVNKYCMPRDMWWILPFFPSLLLRIHLLYNKYTLMVPFNAHIFFFFFSLKLSFFFFFFFAFFDYFFFFVLFHHRVLPCRLRRVWPNNKRAGQRRRVTGSRGKRWIHGTTASRIKVFIKDWILPPCLFAKKVWMNIIFNTHTTRNRERERERTSNHLW